MSQAEPFVLYFMQTCHTQFFGRLRPQIVCIRFVATP
jgi:hypothetical protein